LLQQEVEALMSDLNERNRYGRMGRNWNDERSGWRRGRAAEERWRGERGEPQYSSDEDETLGSEWERGRSYGEGQGPRSPYGGVGGMYGGGLSGGYAGGYAGRGPKGYVRSDERMREEVCERLSRDDYIDASEIEVRVQDGEVTLAGTVPTRRMKHRAEDLADDVTGVSDVHNRLRVTKPILSELKDKVTGKDDNAHYAGTGTKNETVAAYKST
jgi:hypothetical protein